MSNHAAKVSLSIEHEVDLVSVSYGSHYDLDQTQSFSRNKILSSCPYVFFFK